MVLLRFREVGKFHCYGRFLTVTVNLLKNLMFTVLDNPPSRPSSKDMKLHSLKLNTMSCLNYLNLKGSLFGTPCKPTEPNLQGAGRYKTIQKSRNILLLNILTL